MTPSIEVTNLCVRFGSTEAVKNVSFEVNPGRCHALLGRNGAGKTTTLRAVLGLVPPTSGEVKIFGLSMRTHEAEIKSRMAFVSDQPGFYAWMNVREALDYAASLRLTWSPDIESQLMARFELDPRLPCAGLSKGQKTQLALIGAVAADPDLLVLDEPTSGLDPIVRRQFLQAVIGAFQDRHPERKALFVSTHLVNEFEGVVDDFTVMHNGSVALSLSADDARARFRRLRAWFDDAAPSDFSAPMIKPARREGRMLEVLVDHEPDACRNALTRAGATRVEATALSLEEIFLEAAR